MDTAEGKSKKRNSKLKEGIGKADNIWDFKDDGLNAPF